MDQFLTIDDLAKTLKVSKPWLYRLVADKKIPYFRVNEKCVRFFWPDIEKWLEERRQREYHRDRDRR